MSLDRGFYPITEFCLMQLKCKKNDYQKKPKGFAVDQITRLIRNDEIKNFLVEIGGEGFASGFRKDGKHWRIGINRPHKDAPVDQAYKI
jgi:hypothetical protein